MDKKKKPFILFLFFLIGMGSTVSQAILFREFFVIFYGNELVWGVILFAWLFSIGMGAGIYPFVEKKGDLKICTFANLCFLFSSLPFILILLIRISRNMLEVPYGLFIPFYKMLPLCFFIIFLPGFLIGFLFPFGCKLLNHKSAVWQIFTIESLGSLFGGILFSFVLIRYFSTLFISSLMVLLFSMVLFLFSIKTGVYSHRKRTIFNIIFILITSLFLSGSSYLDRLTIDIRWQNIIQDLPLLVQKDTPYQNIAITKQMDQYSVFFNGIYGYSFPDPYNDEVLANHIAVQHPRPRNILIMGEVTPELIFYMKKTGIDSIDYIYIDPDLTSLIEPFMSQEGRSVLTGKGVRAMAGDARRFVKDKNNYYDIIYIKLGEGTNSLSNRYYTIEFFEEVKKALKGDGVLGFGLTSSENYMGSQILDYNTTLYKTLKRVFPYISVSPGTYTYFFASVREGVTSDDCQELMKRYEDKKSTYYGISPLTMDVTSDFDSIAQGDEGSFSPYLFEFLYEPERVRFKKEILEKEIEKVPVNSDLAPVGYLYNLKLWDKYSDSRLENIIAFTEKRGVFFWIGLMAVLVFLFFIYALVLKNKIRLIPVIPNRCPCPDRSLILFAYGFSVFSTGFVSMGLSVILIFMYQNLYGYLFEHIGFLVALFMLGLAIGGILANHITTKLKGNTNHFVINICCVALLSALIPALLSLIKNQPPFYFFLLTVLVGTVTGSVFPMASLLMNRLGNKPSSLLPIPHMDPPSSFSSNPAEIKHACLFSTPRGITPSLSASIVDFADHLGGSFSALIISAFLIPLLGVISSCLILSALSFTGILLWLILTFISAGN